MMHGEAHMFVKNTHLSERLSKVIGDLLLPREMPYITQDTK